MADENIQFKEEIEVLANEVEGVDNPPISLSDNIDDNFIPAMNKLQEIMNMESVDINSFKSALNTAKEAAKKIDNGFAVFNKINSLESKINALTDENQKKETYNYFKKKLGTAKSLKDNLENPLEKEVKEMKASFDKNKDKHPKEFLEIAVSLKEFPNLPNINAVFMGLESLAFNNKSQMIKDLLSKLDKVSRFIEQNMESFLNDKLNPDLIKDKFKKSTGKSMIEIFIDPKNLLSPQDYEIELNQTHQVLQNIANTIERYRDSSKKPIYKKLLNFYWNAMVFYEAMEDELEKNNDTKGLAEKIDAKGDEFAKKYQDYAKLYNPDELSKIVSYLDNKIGLFEEIYHTNYVKLLNNYNKITDAIESNDKSKGIKPLILAIISAKLSNENEAEMVNKVLESGKEIVNNFNTIDYDQNDEIQKLTIPNDENLKKIEKDIAERLGKIELIDNESIKIFGIIDDAQKDLIQDLNQFMIKVKAYWENDGSLNAQEIMDIKQYYKMLIQDLRQVYNFNSTIIKHYKSNLESINLFINNFDIMYDLLNKMSVKKVESREAELKKILDRFDFNENDLDKLITSDAVKKQAINEYFNDEHMNELNEALNILKGVI